MLQPAAKTVSVSTSPSAPALPRAAATVVVVRDASAGPEVLLLRRAERGDHNSGAWVFPGGLVDAADHAAAAFADGVDAMQAASRLDLPDGALAYYLAAVRECFEEAGLLYAHGADAAALADWRMPLQRGERTLAELCRAAQLRLSLDALTYLAHWVTPMSRLKRFDTRFFIARAPEGQIASHDADELVEQLWLRPAEALERSLALKLLTPTTKTLATLARFDDVAGMLTWARALSVIPRTQPNLGVSARGKARPVLPDEPAWAELGRIDPLGRGDACFEIQPGAAIRLSPRVIRVTANNGSVMTGPGTNAYLVGGGPANEWAVIDPGPAGDTAHIEALLAAAPGPIRWIFVTHTHVDHSPGCVALKERTGAIVLGRRAAHPEWQDAGFAPDREVADGERFELDGATLTAIHTPGHASNHLCYRLEEEKTLFTGDHVMQLSTVVINPPDGNMAAYLQSLANLRDGESLDWLAPGHGFLMAQPRRVFEAIIAHRLKREAKVADALAAHGPAPLATLLAYVYDDVPAHLHAVAQRSLRAHLIKLREDGRARESEGGWAPT